MITVAASVPKQKHDRKSKLTWLDDAMGRTECQFFITPQEYFGGIVPMPDDKHIEKAWMLDQMGKLAQKHKKALGVGACVKHESGGATEDFMYFDTTGKFRGHHRKFALPAYDDVRAKGGGALWPEVSYESRARLIEIPELGLKLGTIFCWEVFSLTLFPAYSFAGCNLIVHPIKFAPRGWPKLTPKEEGARLVIGFGHAPDSDLWKRKLIAASEQECLCPIAVTCNTWDLGEKFMAFCGFVDEMLKTTDLEDVPSNTESERIKTYQMNPAFYTGIDQMHSMGAFKEHVGSVDGFHKLGQWKMNMKVRRLEAQFMGGTTRLDCLLKSTQTSRQKPSSLKRARARL